LSVVAAATFVSGAFALSLLQARSIAIQTAVAVNSFIVLVFLKVGIVLQK
jgi:hypothetical protein